jgi:hypothetical protein
MATKPLTYPGHQPTNKREMQEVKAPELFQFTKPNQVLEGVLVSIEPITLSGKQTLQYVFEQPENQARMACNGVAQLNKAIRPTHLGHWLEIRYEGDQKLPNQQADHNDMKIFKVSAGKTIEPGYEHLRMA